MATSANLREINHRKILTCMLRQRRLSRTELARETGMSQPTVGRIVEGLLEQSVLRESDPRLQERQEVVMGRPSRPLELDNQKRRFLAIRVGVRKTFISCLSMAVPDADSWEAEFNTPDTEEAWFKALQTRWTSLRFSPLQALVLSLPGVVDEAAGKVLFSPNLRWTEKVDFPQRLAKLFKAPVLMVQEIQALAQGQLLMEPQQEDFLLVDLGDGVGAAAVIGGHLYRGPLALSGELGHTPILGQTRPCGCGSLGCLETIVSRQGLLMTSKQHKGPDVWEELIGELGRGAAPAWFGDSMEAAAATIAGALNLLGLKHVVLTGSVAEFPTALSQKLAQSIQTRAMWSRFGQVDVEVALRHRLAGMLSVAIEGTLLS